MKKLVHLSLMALFVLSCGEDIDETKPTCLQTGCETGYHCNSDTGQCDVNCTTESCGEQGLACNTDTGLCEFDCTLSGCDPQWVCDPGTRQCVESCLYWTCYEGFHCNPETELCDENCTEGSCQQNERCNLETGLCESLVQFADANFERCVRERISKPEGTILPEELTPVDWLECPDYQIQSIDGIQHLTGLVYLTLWENQIADIGPLANLTALSELQLGNNAIADIGPLAGLTGLTRLGLADNQITDIGPLSGLTNLQWLNLDDNEIATVSPLDGFTNLTWLTIDDTGISTYANQTITALKNNGCEVYPGWDHASKAAEPDFPGAAFAGDRPSLEPLDPPVLNFTLTEQNEVLFDYLVDGESYEVFRLYPGGIYLEDEVFTYRFLDHEMEIGRIAGNTIGLCSGEYDDLCDLSFGMRMGTDGLDPSWLARGGVPRPVFTANLNLLPRGLELWRGYPAEKAYGDSWNLLDPYVLASPNQYDAGSCLFMAVTGAMEMLLNQHVSLEDIQYEGDTDLSERYLMTAPDHVPASWIPWFETDTLFTYNYFDGALLNRDYRFTAGYVCDTASGMRLADPSEDCAYFTCQINWIDQLPDDFEEMLVPTPEVDRTFLFLDPRMNHNSVWNVGLMDDDTVARIQWELRTKRAPVVVIFNYFMYWHTAVVVGYDDTRRVNPCSLVHSSLEYYEEQEADTYVDRIEAHMEELGGCLDHGIFYVRDSIYDGGRDELMYSYSDVYNFEDRYSDRIVNYDYDWIRYLSNYAYTVHRR